VLRNAEVLTAEPAGSAPTGNGHGGPALGIEKVFAEVLAGVLHVERVPVDSHFFDDLGADSMVMAQFCARVRKRTDLPSVSMKDVYQRPTIRGLAAARVGGPGTGTQKIFAEVLADVLHVERVPVDSHFFDDLGADSMVMAQFCARVRKRTDLPSVSMKDVYQRPTIRSLATGPGDTAPSPVEPSTVESSVPASIAVPTPAGTRQYLLCGALQFLIFLAYIYLGACATTKGYEWVSAGSGLVDLYLRSVVFGTALFLGACTLPIVAKWVLIGRWKHQEIRIWSMAYVRFWLVKTLIRANPLVLLMAGSPLYALYLRALGAKVGRGVVIFSHSVPVCTDLLTIGDGTVVRKDAVFPGYRAHAGLIQTGAVTLGRDAFVGEVTVIDIETSLGDGAQLGHSSSLHAGQAVPDGERWHGSPAQRTDVDYRAVDPTDCGTLRRVIYAVMQLVNVSVLYMPLALGGVDIVLAGNPHLTGPLTSGTLALTSWTFFGGALTLSFVLFFGAALVGLVFVVTVPRVLNIAIKPDKVYPLYGFHYSVHRAIARLTNIKFFTYLFGDSSYIVPYLRSLGYDLSRVEQTGSNFGTGVKHETPFLSSVGSGTMVADGLSIINADFSSTSFRLSRTSIGPHNFLGNRIAYPSQGRTGDNCLIATKAMVPIDGPIREGVGLLGSPSFEIPRSVLRDSRLDLRSEEEFRRRLTAKNKYNLRTMGLALLVRWIHVFGLMLLAVAAAHFYRRFGAQAVAAEILLATLFTAVYFVLIERAAARFRPLRPQLCSIYDPYFWWHERYWKLVIPEFDRAFAGTPFKNLVSRLLGTRLGRRVFDDGCFLPERTLVTIGDDCTLNAGSVVQCHSQEDGAFKSDRTTIGAGATLGTGAFVHYGVTIGDGAVLAADCFLMKGEQVPPHARWGGNPASEMRDDGAGPQLRLNSTHDRVALISGPSTGRHRASGRRAVTGLASTALHTATAARRHG
jgi:non-ribosomal peptide synthetase-like protein